MDRWIDGEKEFTSQSHRRGGITSERLGGDTKKAMGSQYTKHQPTV